MALGVDARGGGARPGEPVQRDVVQDPVAGDGLAAEARRAPRGQDPAQVVDERGGVGGRWLDRLDPGARSRGSLSESTLPGRPRTPAESSPFADAMRSYLQRVAAWTSMGERLLTDRVASATQAQEGSWNLHLGSGDTLEAQFFVLATGLEGDPVVPEIRGMDAFEGPLLHTHVWDPAAELDGHHVAAGPDQPTREVVAKGVQCEARQVCPLRRLAPVVPG